MADGSGMSRQNLATARLLVDRGVDMPTLAFAWLFSNPDVTAVVAGPRRPEHLDPAFDALQEDAGEEIGLGRGDGHGRQS